MSKKQTVITLLVLFIVALLNVPSCAGAASQKEYDELNQKYEKVNNELSEAKNQMALLQSELAEAEKIQAKYDELNQNYEGLRKKYDALSGLETIKPKFDELTLKYDNMEKQFNDLTVKYEDMKKQYDVMKAGTAGVSNEDVEQAIFELINQERTDNGLSELMWSEGPYIWARKNSQTMATKGSLQYSEYPRWQEIFIAAGYSTTDRIANGALLTWKANSYRFTQNILPIVPVYGAVSAHKLGDVFFITYIADV